MILVGLYSGHSPPSLVVRGFTGSRFSHVSIVVESTGVTYEAWHNGGDSKRLIFTGQFRKVRHPWSQHRQGTPVKFLRHRGMNRLAAETIIAKCEDWSRRKVEYDYLNVFRFLTRRDREVTGEEKLFCSEAAAIAHNCAGLRILRAHPSLIAPHHIDWSTEMEDVTPDVSGWMEHSDEILGPILLA
jgi:hypothetical protein